MNNIDNLKYERELGKKFNYIAGVDEVGRGPLIGPVVAAAVILPKGFKNSDIKDSKKLSDKKRRILAEIIKKEAVAYSIGVISAKRIDEINILNATKEAMIKAINGLKVTPDYVLIDAVKLDLKEKSEAIIKGDNLSISIASASIIAKVYRDDLMLKMALKYPEYDLINNMGYPTKKHLEAIEKYGVVDEHRKSYKPVKKVLNDC